ncbi:MAG TPA: co-chaperone GroES [Anaerolineales bacterium]|nr:co-chaperone GroES [Anaerolineales bacterium]
MASKLKLKPLGGRVIIEPIEQEEVTAGGIILPETAKEKPQEGKVLAVGPGDRNEHTGERVPMDLKVGDKILFAKYSGTEIKMDGRKLLILRESDILAVVVES